MSCRPGTVLAPERKSMHKTDTDSLEMPPKKRLCPRNVLASLL